MPSHATTGHQAPDVDLPLDPPLVGRADWARDRPELVQGVTTRAAGDFRLRGPAAGGEVLPRWDRLREGLGMTGVVHARQVHGAAIRVARGGPAGLLLTPPCDGHLTREAGVLLTVSVADCVPIFMVASGAEAIGLLHGGWRGVAAGILERGVEAMWTRFGIEPGALELHFGPAISGERYEVGPEVFEALERGAPAGPEHLDLRDVLIERALAAGCDAGRVRASAVCVYDDPRFFSHRGGDAERQLAVLGLRRPPADVASAGDLGPPSQRGPEDDVGTAADPGPEEGR